MAENIHGEIYNIRWVVWEDNRSQPIGMVSEEEARKEAEEKRPGVKIKAIL